MDNQAAGHWRLIVVINPVALTQTEPPLMTCRHPEQAPPVAGARPPAVAPSYPPGATTEEPSAAHVGGNGPPSETRSTPAPACNHTLTAGGVTATHAGGGTRRCRHCQKPRIDCACTRCLRCRMRMLGRWQCDCVTYLDDDACPLWHTDGESSEHVDWGSSSSDDDAASPTPRRRTPSVGASPPLSPFGGEGCGGTRVPAGRVSRHDAGVPRGPS